MLIVELNYKNKIYGGEKMSTFILNMAYKFEDSSMEIRFYKINLSAKPTIGLITLLPINNIKTSVKEIKDGIAYLEIVYQKVKDESEMEHLHEQLFLNGWDPIKLKI